MNPGLAQILGRTIAHVLVKERGTTPRSQVFLVFTDGTYYEFYCTEGNISPTSAAYRGGVEDVRAYMPSGAVVFEA